jgi:hypothetical protein
MGVIVYKVDLGTTITGPEGKQRILLAIARICSIFYSGSIKTINMGATEPMEVSFKIHNRAAVALKTKDFSQQLLKDLVAAQAYEIKIMVAVVQVKFSYNRDFHMDNSINIELTTAYGENMSKLLMGLILSKNIVATQSQYERASDRIERTYDLMRTIFKKFLGDTLFHTLNRINVEKYNRDVIYFNLFGFEFTIKRKYQ